MEYCLKEEPQSQSRSGLDANHADFSMRKQMRCNAGHVPMVALKVNEQSAKTRKCGLSVILDFLSFLAQAGKHLRDVLVLTFGRICFAF